MTLIGRSCRYGEMAAAVEIWHHIELKASPWLHLQRFVLPSQDAPVSPRSWQCASLLQKPSFPLHKRGNRKALL